MTNTTLKNLLKNLEHNKLKAELDLETRKKNLYIKIPKLQELDDEINSYAIKAMKSLLHANSSETVASLKEHLDNLKSEKEKILKDNNIDFDFFKPNYECSKCNDTGYIFKDDRSYLCNCIKQKIFNIEFNKSNICNISKENFSTFNLDFYSDEANYNKYNEKISPRANILKIKEITNNFINNFDNPNEKNLLFTGNTGLGKTFLSNCVADELLKKRENGFISDVT